MRRAALLAALLLAPGLAGCFGGPDDARAGLVPYPRLGDVAVYELSGAFGDLARWENGVALPKAQVRFTLSPSADALDGARAHHRVFKLTTELAHAGVFARHSERYVALAHQAVVQSVYPLSQDQSVVAFDERGYPWLFGASALIGEDVRPGARVPFAVPDNLGRGASMPFAWVARGEEEGLLRLDLEGAGASGSLWLGASSPWPERVSLRVGHELAPHVRIQSLEPLQMEARLVSLARGAEPLPPRDREATFGEDPAASRAAWDGEKPPDGEAGAIPYPLAEAAQEAKLLDRPLAEWLSRADAPIVYRATFQEEPGPVEGSTSAHWLIQWVDRGNAYYEVQISKLFAPPVVPGAPLPVGVPRVESSAPAQPPADPNHGWFPREAVPEKLVPLSEGIRVVRDTFGAQAVQIFLRSFTDPPGYSYFLDGGIEEGGPGRYTVVYNPSTAFIEHATGPVSARLAAE
ncbi:MAG TPA: hypothetical protein VM582_10535 [Candidatus Thermoplasmatota archaeon]|nr:hypothetical protein [Candidatus Thermoplasmatota archaeon]